MPLGQTLLRFLGWEEFKGRMREHWHELTRKTGFAVRLLITYFYAFMWGMCGLLVASKLRLALMRMRGKLPAVPVAEIDAFLRQGSSALFIFILMAALGGLVTWALLSQGFDLRKRRRAVWCLLGALGLSGPFLWSMACDYSLQLGENSHGELLITAVVASCGAMIGLLAHVVAERCAAERLAGCEAAE